LLLDDAWNHSIHGQLKAKWWSKST
jgi:hypothetical protein